MGLFYHGHHLIFATIRRTLLNEHESFFSTETVVASLVNALLALLLFPLLDRLRK